MTVPGKLFIGGLSPATTTDHLEEYFSQFGEIVDCVVLTDSATGRTRGFGFVTFRMPECCDAVLVSKPHVINGREVDAKLAVPREEMQQSGNGAAVPPKADEAGDKRAPPTPGNGDAVPSSNGTGVQTRKVFIGGLPAETSDEDLLTFFKQFGEIEDAVVIHDKRTRLPRGFGFVTFWDLDAAIKVVDQKHHEFMGKTVEAKHAEPKPPPPVQPPRQSRHSAGGYHNGRGNGHGNRSRRSLPHPQHMLMNGRMHGHHPMQAHMMFGHHPGPQGPPAMHGHPHHPHHPHLPQHPPPHPHPLGAPFQMYGPEGLTTHMGGYNIAVMPGTPPSMLAHSPPHSYPPAGRAPAPNQFLQPSAAIAAGPNRPSEVPGFDEGTGRPRSGSGLAADLPQTDSELFDRLMQPSVKHAFESEVPVQIPSPQIVRRSSPYDPAKAPGSPLPHRKVQKSSEVKTNPSLGPDAAPGSPLTDRSRRALGDARTPSPSALRRSVSSERVEDGGPGPAPTSSGLGDGGTAAATAAATATAAMPVAGGASRVSQPQHWDGQFYAATKQSTPPQPNHMPPQQLMFHRVNSGGFDPYQQGMVGQVHDMAFPFHQPLHTQYHPAYAFHDPYQAYQYVHQGGFFSQPSTPPPEPLHYEFPAEYDRGGNGGGAGGIQADTGHAGGGGGGGALAAAAPPSSAVPDDVGAPAVPERETVISSESPKPAMLELGVQHLSLTPSPKSSPTMAHRVI